MAAASMDMTWRNAQSNNLGVRVSERVQIKCVTAITGVNLTLDMSMSYSLAKDKTNNKRKQTI